MANNFDASRYEWTIPKVVGVIEGYKNNQFALAVTIMTDTETGKTTKNYRIGKGFVGKDGDHVWGKTFFQFKAEMLPDVIDLLKEEYENNADQEAEESADEEY